jgi:FkbM family methyltransferase
MQLSDLLGGMMQVVPRSIKDRLKRRYSVPDMEWSLGNLARLGFDPRCTFDVGAYEGHWTELCKTIFPRTQVAMIEGQPAKRDALDRAAARYPGEVFTFMTLAGAESRTDVVYYENETVSSVLPEGEHTAARRVVAARMRTLDDLAIELGWDRVSLIKIDVQGYELEVLKGATAVLSRCEVVLVEVNLIAVNTGAALVADTLGFMREHGFRLYDICSLIRRPLDHALWQSDFLFVREGHPLVASNAWGN